MIWDTKRVILAGAVIVGLTQIGHGLKVLSWLINVPDVAYGAKATAEDTKSRFDKFLDKMDTYTQAMQQTLNRDQTTTWVEHDEQGTWCCKAKSYDECWKDKRWELCETPTP